MTFKQGLIKGRGQITFLAGLIAACSIAAYLQWGVDDASGAASRVRPVTNVPAPQAGRSLPASGSPR